MHCEIITTVVLANTTITLHEYHFFFMVQTFKINSLRNFQLYDMVLLTIMTMLYIRFPRTYLITGSLYPLTTFTHFPHSPAPDNHNSTLFMSSAFLVISYSICLCLTYFTTFGFILVWACFWN